MRVLAPLRSISGGVDVRRCTLSTAASRMRRLRASSIRVTRRWEPLAEPPVAPGSWPLAHGSKLQAPGARPLAPDSWPLAPGPCRLASGPWLLASGPWPLARAPGPTPGPWLLAPGLCPLAPLVPGPMPQALRLSTRIPPVLLCDEVDGV